jgi:homogentisate 1,2-dioxygenase
MPEAPVDFVDSLFTMAANGNADDGAGVGIHMYAANQSMHDTCFMNADGEMLCVLQLGGLRFVTEFGPIEAHPGEVVVVPRGVRFRVELLDGGARGYVCENFGAPFRLPELGPIGSNGLANARDFLTPVAAFVDADRPTTLIQKFCGYLYEAQVPHDPFDVVAWHGNYAPYKYDLARFNTIGTVSFDHPDPSIFTVLTSPTDTPGVANCDFVIFPPRWMVAEHTFRPPWFHRNVMSEFMGLIEGVYDAKPGGFVPGGASLHNRMSAHGPDVQSYRRAIEETLAPVKQERTMAFMFESRRVLVPTQGAIDLATRESNYDACWSPMPKGTLP